MKINNTNKRCEKVGKHMKKNDSIESNQKGITMIALTITIILLFILSGIAIYSGKDTIRRANLEELKTNMLLIQTKAREFVENASFDLGIDPQNATEEMRANAQNELNGEDKGTLVEEGDPIESELLSIGISQNDIDNGNVYKLTTQNLENMGVKDVESNDTDGWYVIVYDITNTTAEIYNTIGYEGKYSLTDLERLEL